MKIYHLQFLKDGRVHHQAICADKVDDLGLLRDGGHLREWGIIDGVMRYHFTDKHGTRVMADEHELKRGVMFEVENDFP